MTSLFPSWRRFLHHPSNPDPPPLQTPTNREELFFFGFLNQKDLSSEGVSLCESIGVLKLNGGGGGEKIKQTLFLHLRRHRLNIFQLEKYQTRPKIATRLITENVHCQVIKRQELTW